MRKLNMRSSPKIKYFTLMKFRTVSYKIIVSEPVRTYFIERMYLSGFANFLIVYSLHIYFSLSSVISAVAITC